VFLQGGAKMRRPRNIVHEIEEELNGYIYSQVAIENFDDGYVNTDDVMNAIDA
jgi:hypothetical protein